MEKVIFMTNETQATRVLEAFLNGDNLTSKQITARFGIANPRAVVNQLRNMGYAIYLNKHRDTKGRETQKYRLGTPSRKLIAAGYAALGADAFSR
jgi:hypothetical protein